MSPIFEYGYYQEQPRTHLESASQHYGTNFVPFESVSSAVQGADLKRFGSPLPRDPASAGFTSYDDLGDDAWPT